MKVDFSKIIFAALPLFVFAACSKWVTPEPVDFDSSLTESNKDEAYYEALRAFKASDHKISFGWFDGWDVVPGSASLASSLSFVPDSMDVISLWSGSGNLTPAKLEDLRFVTEKKGTKVLLCSFFWKIGDMYHSAGKDATLADIKAHYGWVDKAGEANFEAIDRWVKDIADSLDHYGFSGIDIDYEPSENPGTGNTDPLMPNATYFSHFIQSMGKYIGPQSGTGKMFILDGYVNTFPNPAENAKYFDYFVSQAYTRWGAGDTSAPVLDKSELQSRLNSFYNHVKDTYPDKAECAKKFVVTDNLEAVDVCLAGGYFWKDEMGIWSRDVMPTLVGFAYWTPDDVPRAGGFGGYKFSHERGNTPPWKWIRRAIQQANPSADSKIVTADDYKPGTGRL